MITVTIKINERVNADPNDKKIGIDVDVNAETLGASDNELRMQQTLYATLDHMLKCCEDIKGVKQDV